MQRLNLKILIVCLCILFDGKTKAKIVLQHIGICHVYNNPPVEIKHSSVKIAENGSQFLNYDVIIKIPLDAKVGITISLEYSTSGKRYITVRTLKEKNACRTFSAYGGPLWKDIAALAGIAKGCPIQPGHYKVDNKELDLNKMAFQGIPFGTVRLNFTLLHNSNKQEFLCSDVEVVRD